MSVKSGKDEISILEKDFSKEVAREIMGMIDKLVKEGLDNDKIEQEVAQHILDHIEKDLSIVIRGARTGLHGPTKVGTLGKTKRK